MRIGNTDIFEVLTCFFTIFIALRAFLLYAQLRGSRLFILGLSMVLFSLTTIAGIVHNLYIFPVPFNTTWFSFVGQTAAFLFLFFSSLGRTENYLSALMRWQIITSILITLLIILAPIVPDVSNTLEKALFILARALVCLIAFFGYTTLFMKKETRFGFFMMAAFLLLSAGYVLLVPRFFLSHADLLTIIGDILRIIGLIALAAGLLAG